MLHRAYCLSVYNADIVNTPPRHRSWPSNSWRLWSTPRLSTIITIRIIVPIWRYRRHTKWMFSAAAAAAAAAAADLSRPHLEISLMMSEVYRRYEWPSPTCVSISDWLFLSNVEHLPLPLPVQRQPLNVSSVPASILSCQLMSVTGRLTRKLARSGSLVEPVKFFPLSVVRSPYEMRLLFLSLM